MHNSVIAALFTKTHRPIIEVDLTAGAGAGRWRRPSPDATLSPIHLRALTPADAHHMTDLLQRLSPQSSYMRYFRLVRSFAPADIARFVAVNPGHSAVGAFDGGVLVGAAQYFRSSEHPHRAEVALEVADSHHRRRVGTRLVQELARLAADVGITHFTATVLAENRPLLGLIRHSGWEIATTLDGPYADVVVTLPSPLLDHRRGSAAQVVDQAPLGRRACHQLGLTSCQTAQRCEVTRVRAWPCRDVVAGRYSQRDTGGEGW